MFQLSLSPFKFRKYLKKGLYKYNVATTILFRYPVEYNNVPTVFGNIETNKNILRILFSKLFFYRNNFTKQVFNGDYMIVSSSESEFKFFDIDKKRILTYYSDESKLNFVSKQRIEWSKWLRTVEFTVDLANKTLIEPLISTTNYKTEDAFAQIQKDYLKYIVDASNDMRSYYSIDKQRLDSFCNLWNDKDLYDSIIKFIADNPIPVLNTHGDLWRANILFDGQYYYYIDFEQAAPRLFFYDIFMYILSDAFILKDNLLFKDFLEGKFDDYLQLISQKLNYQFIASQKYYYLALFSFEWYCNRWYGTQDSNLVVEVSNLVISQYNEYGLQI